MRQQRQPEWATCMEQRITQHITQQLENIMALVQIDDADLATFASTVETEVAALVTANTGIGDAVTVLQGYIQQLLAGQVTPLPVADETAITTALTDLATNASAIGTSVGNLDALEPVVPTPPSP